MAFIRIKKVKGLDYYFLVKSQWDPDRKDSKQKIIKYLGKASNVTINDIPPEFRNNPRILSTLAANQEVQNEKSLINRELRELVFDSLRQGDIDKIMNIVEKYKKQESLFEFYDSILKPVMVEVGDLWIQNKLDIGTEHVCSNIASRIINMINKLHNELRLKKEIILICTPEGEMHNLGCNVIESVLLEKGFKVSNISPSVPSDSIIEYISDNNPSLVLVSISHRDNLGSGIRLLQKISSYFNVPVLMGGVALNNISEDKKSFIESTSPNVKVIPDCTLETFLQIVKFQFSNSLKKEKYWNKKVP